MSTKSIFFIIHVIYFISLQTIWCSEQSLTHQDWVEIGKLDFEEDHSKNFILEEFDPGIKWSVRNGKGRFFGISHDFLWKGNRVFFPINGDDHSIIEFSGEFETNSFNGINWMRHPFGISDFYGLQVIALWAFTDNGQSGFSPLCLFFEGKNGIGVFKIQTRWLTHDNTLISGERTSPVVNVNKGIHKMKIVLNRSTFTASYFYDNTFLGKIGIYGEIEPIIKTMMDIETPQFGIATDIDYDNLKVRKKLSYLFPKILSELFLSALNEEKKGNHLQAIQALEDILHRIEKTDNEIDPDFKFNVHNRLAYNYHIEKEYSKAIGSYKKALIIFPENIELMYILAKLYQ